MSEATIESIISDRLITHESVVGANQPSIQNTTKRFFQFSETVQQSKEDVEALFLKADQCFMGGNYFKGKSEAYSGVPKRLV